MNAPHMVDGEPVAIEDSWARSVTDDLERSRRIAWIVAGVSAAIALLLAIALVILLPLKRVEPYTLLVDRQTGYVEELAPLERQVVAPDAALTRSFLVQYVIARESHDAADLQDDYRKVALWSAGEARERYVDAMQPANPASPVNALPPGTVVRAEIKSVSSLGPNRSQVRYVTRRVDRGAADQPPQHWIATIDYRFSGAEMAADDRLINPLGFQVTRYRADAEFVPETYGAPVAEAADAASIRSSVP